MFNVVLVEPEIPPNTGNIIRLCANTGCVLHLVHPLGFSMQEKLLRRAGLDYSELATVVEHKSLQDFLQVADLQSMVAFSTKGMTDYHQHEFSAGQWMLFGPETRGLPDDLLQSLAQKQVLRMPMRSGSRSLNLSNTVAIAVYEAWRQNNFK